MKIILIVIPEKVIKEEFPWFQESMGEYAVRTYVIRKPEIIAENLELLGIDVWFSKWGDEKGEKFVEDGGEADLVFRNGKTYYIVETKRRHRYNSGREQVERAVECFKSDMEMHKQEYDEAIAVLITTSPYIEVPDRDDEWGEKRDAMESERSEIDDPK